MNQIKQLLADALTETLGTEVEVNDIERPEPDHGDFAYPCMKAAAALGENPRQIAEENAEELEKIDIVDSVDVAGPGYLNFHLNRKMYAEKISGELGADSMGVKQRDGKMLLEFSSPNVAKPMHIGHFRNNALGDSLQRIMRFVGYDVTSENYLGDWGAQYGKLIYAYLNYGSKEEFEENPMEHMYSLYVKFHELAEEDEDLESKGAEWARKIEEGDEQAVELWQKFRDASIEYHNQDYERMDVHFDRITGESTVVEEAKQLAEELVEDGKIEPDDDGSVFIDFEDMPGVVLRKADGSTLYFTRDLYNLKKRNMEGFDHNLYVVASEQNLHFQQLFELADKLGIESDGSEHVSYGMLSLPEGSMSSRSGNIIRLRDVFDKAVQKAEETAERDIGNPEAVGIGAVKYANLAVSRNKDIEFDWNSVLSFEGDSGPYLQYSNTRAKSIMKKTDSSGELVGDFEEKEYRLLKKLSEFPEHVDAAATQREPAKIANYLSMLCEEFNSFYHSCPVLDAEEADTKRRLKLVNMFIDVTDQGLELLGIRPLEEM